MNFLKYLTIVFVVFIFSQAAAQSGAIRQADKLMNEKNWGKARKLLNKLLDKDSLNMEAHLSLSKWFLRNENPDYQIDSAYRETRWSLIHFKYLAAKQKEKYKKENADSMSFSQLFLKVDSLSFERAKVENNEAAYQKFLDLFPQSIQKVRAMELRDETAFLNALKANTFSAFEGYIRKYPESARISDARNRYERLLFETKTKDKKLLSYELFLNEFPASPYREEAAKSIFKIKTAGGLPVDFQNFISRYSWSQYASKAKSILFYLRQEHEEVQKIHFEDDSLSELQKLNAEIWIPVFKNAKYGFINQKGVERIPPRFAGISSEYYCGDIKDEIIGTREGLINRSGKIIYKPCSVVKDLGLGFLLAGDSSEKSVIHKSGFIISNKIDDANTLRGRFLVVTRGGEKCLLSLSGQLLVPFQKQSIEMMEDVLVIDRYGKKILFRLDQVIAAADGNPVKEEFVFDDVKPVGHHLLKVRNGALDGLVNEKIEFIVPLGRQGLQPVSFGLIRNRDDYFTLEGFNKEVDGQQWKKYKLEKQWLLLQNASAAWLADVYTKKIITRAADSIWLSEGIAFARMKDSIHVYINSKSGISLPASSSVSFVKSSDSIRYFYSQQKNKKVIYDVLTGEKKFAIEADQIESLRDRLFLATRKNKKGLLDKSGKSILPFEYDAVLFKNNELTLLKDKKFGAYSLETSRIMKPSFDRNLVPLDSSYWIASKNNSYGIIDWSAKQIVPFEYDEIKPWGNHMIWVKKNFEWSLINYRSGKILLKKVKNYFSAKEREEENVAIVQQENFYGVVSNLRGVIIQPTFTTVINVGSSEQPFYFTSKEVEEAGVFVVIYYNSVGEFIKKEVYEEAEYEKIVCSEE